MATTVLDVQGLLCPLPVLRANKAFKALADGDCLAVQATDPAAPKDFEAFCETTGYALLESREENGVFHITIRKPG